MAIHDGNNGGKSELAAQIELLERKINIRRLNMSERTILLKHNVRQKLVSPTALISYAGVGVAIGLLTRRPRAIPINAPSSKVPPAAQTAMVRIEQFLAKVFKVVAMGRTLATLLPQTPTPRTSSVSTASISNPQPLH